MRKLWLILLIGLVLVTTSCRKGKKETQEVVVPVKTYIIRPDTIEAFIEITGGLEAQHDAVVYSTISEELVEIRKPVGSFVRKDEIIAVQDNDLWQEMLNQAEAAFSSAKARFEQIKQDYQRFERLHQEKAISQQQWDQIKANYQDAEAALRRAEAAYLQSKEQFENTFIRAPFSGIVGSFNFDVGEMIPAGQPVTRIVNDHMVKADLYLPDVYVNRVRMGQTVVGEFPLYPGEEFTGRITRIDPAIDPLSRTFRVVASFENSRRRLRAGMYGQFRIITDRHSNTIVVPDNAVLVQTVLKVNPKTGQTYTIPNKFVVTVEEGTARFRPVKTGIESRGRVEITEGLAVGEQIIVVGQKVVKDGEKVKIVATNE